ncbi:MAG: DNA polymerase-3 subunit delta, partial [Candidatus Marinamargulisbacteria bacterium]
AKCLMGNQEDPIRLMGMVISNIRTFCQILSLVEQGESSQGIAKATKKNPYFLQKIMPGIQKHYTLEGLKPIYRLLNTRDVEMKSGKIKAEIGLEMAILDICRS